VPCEGTGYEIGSMSIVKGGKNAGAARKWYDWSLTAEAQDLAKRAKSFQVPSNMKAAAPAQMPRMEDMKLIDYDFAKYGSGVERKRIVTRWEKEVGNLPK
jgi:iron(III) transport system substrate-binding protein